MTALARDHIEDVLTYRSLSSVLSHTEEENAFLKVFGLCKGTRRLAVHLSKTV